MSPRSTATGPASAGSGRPCVTGRATSTSCRRRSDAWSGPRDAIPPGADIDRQALDGRDDAYYAGVGDRRIVFDYSADGRRPVARGEPRAARHGPDRLAFIHDPDDHWQAAIDGAYPALHRLREQGVVRAIGVGINQSAMLARFARETEMDAFLVAGRYTLLDQDALPELLPLCAERGISVLIGGVMNSGVLADPRPGAHFDYGPASPEVLDRARRLAEACDRHGVPLRAAAIQFPLAHPAVAGLIAGRPARRPPRRVPGVHALADPAGPVGRPAGRGPDRARRADPAVSRGRSTPTTTFWTRPARRTRG